MPRINLDLDFLDHPKTLTVSPLAQLLFIRSIIYCARHLTDGHLPKSAPGLLMHDFFCPVEEFSPPLATNLIRELVDIGWWTEIGDHYAIHDYLDYQLSRKQVAQLSKKNQENGRKGGLAKAKRKASQLVAKVYPLTNPNPNLKKEDTLAPWQVQATSFWKVFPKKKGKGHVEKWFQRHQPTAALMDTILAKVEILKRTDEWQKNAGQFIPYPFSWLNAKGWEDEPISTPAPRKERLPL
jgi:hypothetical protein